MSNVLPSPFVAEERAPAPSDLKDYPTLREFCLEADWPYSTASAYVRDGSIALHWFTGQAFPRVHRPEAQKVRATSRRFYATARIVRHG